MKSKGDGDIISVIAEGVAAKRRKGEGAKTLGDTGDQLRRTKMARLFVQHLK